MIDRKEDNQFHLVSKYEPSGDQPQAIEALVDNIEGGEKAQILKGATGTGKTLLMPALTLGCGAVGGSATSENVGPMQLLNTKKVA